jgi:hypothetical protein
MDATVQAQLLEVERLGKALADSKAGADAQILNELLRASQRLCIALQSPGRLVEEILFGVSFQGRELENELANGTFPLLVS